LLTSVQANQVTLQPLDKAKFQAILALRFQPQEEYSSIVEYAEYLTGRHVILLQILMEIFHKKNILTKNFSAHKAEIQSDFLLQLDELLLPLLRTRFFIQEKAYSLKELLKTELALMDESVRKELRGLGIVIEITDNTQTTWQLNPKILEERLKNET